MVLIFSRPCCSASASKRGEQLIEQTDGFGWTQARGQRREPDQIGEQDRRVVESVGDRRLAALEPRGDSCREDVQQ